MGVCHGAASGACTFGYTSAEDVCLRYGFQACVKGVQIVWLGTNVLALNAIEFRGTVMENQIGQNMENDSLQVWLPLKEIQA